MRCFLNISANGLRIGDGAALTRKLSYYKLIFETSKMAKLAIPPHYCQYDVSRSCFLSQSFAFNFAKDMIRIIICK